MGMTVVKIGYQDFLFPEGIDPTAVIELLSKALPCNYREWQSPPEIVLGDVIGCKDGESIELELRKVPKKHRVLHKKGEVEVDVTASQPTPRPRKAKTLSLPPNVKQLGNGSTTAIALLGPPPAGQGTLFLE